MRVRIICTVYKHTPNHGYTYIYINTQTNELDIVGIPSGTEMCLEDTTSRWPCIEQNVSEGPK